MLDAAEKEIMTHKHRVRAVHDDDLGELLRSLNLDAELVAGRLKCCICGDVVTEETLQAIVPSENTIKVLCSKTSCFKELSVKDL